MKPGGPTFMSDSAIGERLTDDPGVTVITYV